MMRISLQVEYDSGAVVDVVATAPDLVAFERKYERAMAVFATEPRIEWLMFLAWTALKRRNKTHLDFDPWMDEVAGITVGEDEEIVPLGETAPTG